MKRSIAFLLLVCCHTLFSQNNNDYTFEYFSTEDGLSHNFVTSIISDDLNNKWIGTENGITKTNGDNLEYIKPFLGYKELGNENIETLFRDSKNRIWIGTKSGGISYINPKYGNMKSLNHLIDINNEGDVRVTAISEDSNGYIWIGTWGHGLFVIDVQKEKLVFIQKSYSTIWAIQKANKSEMWVSHLRQIDSYNYDLEVVKTFRFANHIFDFSYDNYRNRLWFTSSSANPNLYFFDYNTTNLDSINTGIAGDGYRNTLTKDNKNRIWIGTWGNGMYRSNTTIEGFKKIKISPPKSHEIETNYNNVLSIHCDPSGQIWIGTANAGVVKLIPGKGFNNLTRTTDFNPSVFKGGLNITSIYKDENQIFLGTLKSGAFLGEKFSSLQPLEGIPPTKIFSFYRYENNIFIGTEDGFYIYNLNDKKIIFENHQFKKVTCFYINQKEQLFIGTQQLGMVIVPLQQLNSNMAYQNYRDEAGKENSLKSNRITAIVGDNNGRIWISTYNGLHSYNQNTGRIQHQSQLLEDSIPSVIINTLHLKEEMIWMGTPSGLYGLRYNVENNALSIEKKLTLDDGLRNDFISSLTSDSENNIWFSSVSNIVKYIPDKNSFINYGKISGILTSSFNNRSVYNHSNKMIYFGGMDNVTFFDPKKINSFEKLPDVIFSTLRINNDLIQFHEEEGSFEKNFSYSNQLVLKPEEDFFSIGFSVNDFLDPKSVNYRYRLKGYQEDWINLQQKNQINFAGLPPGTYQLEVSATRNNQDWSAPKVLDIIVHRPVWLTWWAFLSYTILLSIPIYFFVKFKRNQLKLKTDLEITKIEKEKDFALHESKINFFTNISHEFRTPLTLIVGPVKELINSSKLSTHHRKKLNLVEKNADKLLNLVNQLLDFRKAENGLLKLNASEGNFVRFSKEVYLYFKELAHEKQIQYSFEAKQEEIRFPFDRNKLEIVLCNLISNAIKYSSAGDRIEIKISEKDEKCLISIKDTGIGMNEEDLEKIFDRFFQIKTSNTSKMVGSGIGLTFSKKLIELHNGKINVESQPGKGTKFTVELGMDPALYKGIMNDTFLHTDNMCAYDDIRQIQNDSKCPNKQKDIVLVIDDNPDILTYLFDILQEDYDVRLADSGKKGKELALKDIPDLIICDIMMPGKDGITLCKELKSQISTSHIPIILLTARTSTVFEIEGLNTGASDYINKPFNPAIVKARIASILENQIRMKEFMANKIQFEPSEKINKDSNDDLENDFIREAIGFVESNLQNTDFGIENMTYKFNMSQSTLYRKIKSLTGLSLTAFIRSIRLKHAANLILTTDRNMNEIAYDVGFNDYKYFKVNFKKQFNCLPTKYREKVLKS
ncbi:hybrid sensor histidine kinase/response regulator transcription factor [Christiangramia crocea]|uniref:histidine kinase n=1 Tax=Christiangramia crocea TaxID=2904124 RepID=A0A9X1UYB9_9FLAO|nr:two-component regulator propeller domain-containing protein [Gramella crocea]MCG9972567.1 ATP-binding protein [Gramella crocea]